MPSSAPPPPRSVRLFRITLWVFLASIAFSVAGTLLLSFFPGPAGRALAWIAEHLGLGLQQLVQGPTWVYMALMPLLTFLLYLPALGARRSVLFFLWGSAIGAAAELLGTQTGVPFGAYAYTELLGPRIAGHVPWFIPPSWYAMSLLSYDLAGRLRLRPLPTVAVAAAFMTLWDVALDPAMTAGAHSGWTFWSYAGGGAYFGMPLVNWAGWLLTSAVIMAGYRWLLGGLEDTPQGAPRAAPVLYAVNVLFPVFICFAYGAALAGALGLVALAVPFAVLRWRTGRADGRPAESPASAPRPVTA